MEAHAFEDLRPLAATMTIEEAWERFVAAEAQVESARKILGEAHADEIRAQLELTTAGNLLNEVTKREMDRVRAKLKAS